MTSGAPSFPRHSELLDAATSRLLVVDVQEKLLAAMPARERVVDRCRRLLFTARVLGVPSFATEQYPRGLGSTCPELSGFFDAIPDKLNFSAADCLGWPTASADKTGRDQVVICGLEAHVCVLQTVFDLLARGYRPYVTVDAIDSRHAEDRETALRRLESAGATLVTSEMVLFEWCERAGTAEFQQIRKLVTGS